MRSCLRAIVCGVIVVGWLGCATQGACGKRACCPRAPEHVQRFGMVIQLLPEKIAEYKELHANAWPAVLEQIRKSHIRNYSIYLHEIEPGKFYLFSYFEYVGKDFEGDMKAMAADPTTQKWWALTDPCQKPIPLRGPNDRWWTNMQEVFHCD